MARIPIRDYQVGVADGQVAPYQNVENAGALGRQIGNSISSIAGDVFQYQSTQNLVDARLKKIEQNLKIQDMEANAGLDLKQAGLDALNGPDPSKANEAFRKSVGEIQDKYSQLAGGDPAVSSELARRMQLKAKAQALDVQSGVMKYRTNAIVGGLNNTLDTLAQTRSLSSSDAERAAIDRQAIGLYQSAVESGILRPDQAQAQAQDWLGKADETTARRLILESPDSAVQQLQSGRFGNIEPLKREELTAYARNQSIIRQNADRVEIERADAQRRRYEEERSKQAEDSIISDAFSANPQITTRQISNNDALTPDAKLRMIGVINQMTKGDPPSQVSRATTARMFQDMHLPDGDPHRITSMEPVDTAFANGLLTREDYSFLRTNLTNYTNSPDGQRFGTRVGEFLTGMKSSITKSNPLLGQLDSSGDAQFYRYQRFVQDSVDQYRKDGKNPDDLINPASPSYLGKQDVLAGFQTSIAQSTANISRNLGVQSSQQQAQEAQSKPGFFSRFFGTSASEPETPKPSPKPPAGPIILTPEQADAQGIPTFASPSDAGYAALRSGQPFRSGFDGSIRYKP